MAGTASILLWEREISIVLLTEGVGVRSVAQLAGMGRGAVLRVLVEAAEFATGYQRYRLRDPLCERVEADEIWSYCGAKEKNATQPDQGDLYTLTAIALAQS